MDISIIIPTYNRQQLLKHTLDSVVPDKHASLACEVIVVDDQSTDATVGMVTADYPFVTLIKNGGNGAAAARNTGLGIATGKYVLYLDSDDIVGEGALSVKVDFLNKHADYDFCYGDYEYFQSEAEFRVDTVVFWNKYQVAQEGRSLNQHLINYLKGDYIPPNAIVWRRTALEKIGGHDPSLLINQDVELFVRAMLNGLKVGYVQDLSKVYVRHHDTDARVGSTNSVAKSKQVLQLRKDIYYRLQQTGHTQEEYRKAISFYAFTEWRRQRDMKSEMADEFLEFAKSVHWPVALQESAGFNLLAKLLGPDVAVRIKYFLFRRNF
ncbi:glycosyltransferase family 2 protein [Polluticoccus soli]|uniref:glycosyltransferase family 2 protein n=1 Tax=Polluticoccus soli TaxID=3034150 RepID=UPI0023E16365|nr:glycosyltransferase family 2 protein [Flavipsychrobacter sp. JY13-12]